MSASSSMKLFDYKPLNPLAASYEPQSKPTIVEHHNPLDKTYLPHQFHFESHQLCESSLVFPQVSEPQQLIYFPIESPYICPHPHPSFRYLSLYNSEKQPHPRGKVFNSPKSCQYVGRSFGSERIVGKKKKGKWGLIPPRLKSPREFPVHSQEVWVKKLDAEEIKVSSDHVHVTGEEPTKLDGKTSVMIKNVPNHFQRVHLQRVLDYHCRAENRKAQPGSDFCKSEYDFLYLPMDFGFHLNLGFAFVNFTSPVAALRFYRALNNREWSSGDRKKICEIGIAKIQGKDAFKEQFHKSSFPCHTNAYLPVVFSPPRDGFNRSRPTVVGRRTHVTATISEEQKVMIMTKRKNKKA